jgi:uncharacterized protein (UPF0248 family)
MAEKTLRDVLNRLRWDGSIIAAGAVIEFVTRGESGEHIEVAPLEQVTHVTAAGVTLAGGTFIPYHRVRHVRRGGEELWRAREKRGGDES